MSEIAWEVLRNGVYHIDGSWRDIYVLNTSRADWDNWAHYINTAYKLTWYAEGYEAGELHSSISAEFLAEHWNLGAERLTTMASIWVGDIKINCHFFVETEIENDIDPKEVKSLDDHYRLMEYMKSISRLLNQEVILTEENVEDAVWIRVNGDVIHFEEYGDVA